MNSQEHIQTENIMLKPLGDTAVIVQFGSEISPNLLPKIRAFIDLLDSKPFAGFLECVPAFTSATIFYDPWLVYQNNNSFSIYESVCREIDQILLHMKSTTAEKQRVVEIPVCYGGELGLDLEFVAKHNKLSTNEVIDIHSQGEYLVYMIGFAPGFPYLGGLNKKISSPRRSSPRASIPSGSVGIAGNQTGIYPIETPGGWQLIGRTPLQLFNPETDPPTLLESGDIVKFIPISEREYSACKEKLT